LTTWPPEVKASSLPPAATITAFLRSAYFTAAASTRLLAGVSMETLMTWAPSVAASLIPWASTPGRPPFSDACTLTDRMRASGATPVNGTPWVRRSLAAMMPATEVPCPTQSWLPPTREMAVTRPASCRVKSTPLSTTATVTPAPRDSGHTLANASARCAHGCLVTRAANPVVDGRQVGVGCSARVTGTGTSGAGWLPAGPPP
jgi:hypothetical protein